MTSNILKQFYEKAKKTLSPNTQAEPDSPPLLRNINPPTATDILRYRFQHGVNLGSVFVLERWLSPQMFEPSSKGDSELDAVTASLHLHGLGPTRTKWEAHWTSALSEPDIEYLATKAHCTAVRIPIGHFTLGRAFTHRTSFDDDKVADVYENAWAIICALCARLYARGIGNLIDFHGLPGGANGQEHGGTSSKRAALWEDERYRKLATRCVLFVAGKVRSGELEGCIGIQVCNEASWGAKGMYEWYVNVMEAVGEVDPGIPLYVSDAWDLECGLESTSKINTPTSNTNPLIVARPSYFLFTPADQTQTQSDLITRITTSELSALDGSKAHNVTDHGARQLCVVEYSCGLPSSAFPASIDGTAARAFRRNFGLKQCTRWRMQKASGAFFWTWRARSAPEWDFEEMVKAGCVSAPFGFLVEGEGVMQRVVRARQREKGLKRVAVEGHQKFWDESVPEGKWDHWRFESGFTQGYADALGFYAFRLSGAFGARIGGDRIGALEIWILKRLREWLQTARGRVGNGELLWEWEHGFRAGVGTCERVVWN
ncbi:MAG: hypothetical protein Q9195_007725 [Heterodermia aff. obscurata]